MTRGERDTDVLTALKDGGSRSGEQWSSGCATIIIIRG